MKLRNLFQLLIAFPLTLGGITKSGLPENKPLEAALSQALQTVTIYADLQDAELYNYDCTNWADCRNAPGGSGVYQGYEAGTVSTGYEPDNPLGPFYIKRIFQFFDTSSIPADAHITGATLHLMGGLYMSGSQTVHVVPSTGNIPLSSEDYSRIQFVSGGSAAVPVDSPAEISLNSDALSWINKGGITKLALIHEYDLNNTAPTEVNGVTLAMAEAEVETDGPYLEITFESSTASIDVPLDIVLVQDETGSMGDDIGNLSALTPQIWDSIAAISTAEFQMAVAGFRDFAFNPWGGPGDWVYRRLGDFTTSRDDYQTMVNGLTASGGNDTPESQYTTLGYLLAPSHTCLDSNRDGDCEDSNDTPAGQQPNFRSGAVKVILLATDAPFHDPDDTSGYPGPTLDQVAASLLASRAIVIGLVPGGAGRIGEVDYLTQITGGSTQDTGSSGQDVAQAILNALQQLKPVSATLSKVEVDPASLPADGLSKAAIRITLVDTNNRPIVGKEVRLYSDRPGQDVIEQPLPPTDLNGQTTGSIYALAAGQSTVWAVDVTDGVTLQQQPVVQFTLPTIPPIGKLANCIRLLGQHTNRELAILASLTGGAAEDGQYYTKAVGEDLARLTGDAVVGVSEVVFPAYNMNADKIRKITGWRFVGSINTDWGAVKWLKARHPLAGNLYPLPAIQGMQKYGFDYIHWGVINNGLLYFPAQFLNKEIDRVEKKALSYVWGLVYSGVIPWSEVPEYYVRMLEEFQQAVTELQGTAEAGVPIMSESEQELFATDLCARALVPMAEGRYLERHAETAHSLRTARETADLGTSWFMAKFITSQIAYVLWGVPGKVALSGLTTTVDLYIDGKRLDYSQKGLMNAQAFFNGVSQTSTEFYENTQKGYERLQAKIEPQTVTGEIVSVRQYSERRLGIGAFERKSYVVVEVRNTSDYWADFTVKVDYGYNSSLMGLPWVYMPVVEQEPVSIGPKGTGTVKIYLKNESEGGSPDEGSQIGIFVLGKLDGAGLYNVDFWGEAWRPERIAVPLTGAGSQAMNETVVQLPEDTPTIENPIDTYLSGNADGSIRGDIFAANPFTSKITATITQDLPPGFTLLSTDAEAQGSTLTWTQEIGARDIISNTFTVASSAKPGEVISLPPARMTFTVPDTGETISTDSGAPQTQLPWPVEAFIDVPVGVSGVAASVPATLKNVTGRSYDGVATVRLIDASGSEVYASPLPFGTPPGTEQALVFTLPGEIPPGKYRLDLQLSFEGFSGVACSSTYYVQENVGNTLFLPMISTR